MLFMTPVSGLMFECNVKLVLSNIVSTLSVYKLAKWVFWGVLCVEVEVVLF